MENNKSTLGKAFKEGFAQFEEQPDPKVWQAIESKIVTKGSFWTSKYMGLKIAAGVVLIAAAIAVFNLSPKDEAQANKQKETQINVEAQKSPVEVEQKEEQPQTLEIAQETSKQEKSENIETASPTQQISIQESEKKVEEKAPKNIADKKVMKTTVIAPDTLIATAEPLVEHPESQKIEEPLTTATEKSIPKINYSDDPSVCFGEDATLGVSGGKYYYWSTGETSAQVRVSPVENSSYWVTVTDALGNDQVHEFKVTIDLECTTVFVPSAFTPNFDGQNDVFKAEGENIKEFKIQIMSRMGQLVFSSNQIDQSWDGSYKGKMLPSQVFVYTIFYKNARGESKVKTGQITLIR